MDKGKWLYRTAGAVGLASGICLVAGGAAHASDTDTLRDAVDGLLQPLASPLSGGGISAPGLGLSAQDVNMAPATAGEDQVITGQLRDFTPGLPSLDAPSIPSLDGPSNPHILPAPAFGLLPIAPAAPTAAVDREALGTTALTAPTGQRAADLPSLPVAGKVLDQVSVNGTPLTSQDLARTLPLKPNVSMDPKGPQLTPVTNTLSNPVGALGGVGGAPAGQAVAAPPRHAAAEALPVVSQLPVVKGLANGTDPGPARAVTSLPVVQTLVGGQTATPSDVPTRTTQARRPSPRPRPNERPVATTDPEYA